MQHDWMTGTMRSGIAALMFALLPVFALLPGAAAQAADKGPATFLNGVYASAKDCVVHELLPRSKWNLYTAPDYYDSTGWHGWETDCRFTSARQLSPERYEATLECTDPAGEEKHTSKPVFEIVDETEMAVKFEEAENSEDSQGQEQIFNCKKLVGTQ